jgi:hypothetical protein
MREASSDMGDHPSPRLYERMPAWAPLLAILAFMTVQVVALRLLGQPAVCACGYVALWHGEVLSPENSQHLTDWYTFTHVIHGFGFYLLLWLIAPSMPFAFRLACAMGLEAAWEVLENTPYLIERYRESALAQGYFGDSIINSVFDTLATGLGFALARMLPISATLTLLMSLARIIHEARTAAASRHARGWRRGRGLGLR